MKRPDIQRALSQLQNEPQENVQSSQTKLVDEVSMHKWWAFMVNALGSSFTRQYGETINPIWKQSIQLLTKEQIWKGTQVMLDVGSDYPPILPVFLRYCREGKLINKGDDVVRPNFNQGQIPANYEHPALSGTVTTADEARAKCKEMLGI